MHSQGERHIRKHHKSLKAVLNFITLQCRDTSIKQKSIKRFDLFPKKFCLSIYTKLLGAPKILENKKYPCTVKILLPASLA